ncbi:MAG: endonuclease III [Candidatus Cloacimonetes bacterium]|nr:endonuclease III [Candidatus Cloacimonadota bacterium]
MRIDYVMNELGKLFSKYRTPVVDLIEAQTKDPFKVLVATILSARTNDRTTASVLPKLFSVVDKPEDLLVLSVTEISDLIYPVGFYRNKAVFLKELPATLNKLFNGVIPDEIDDLVKLPGVGRKTANLVRAVAFGKPAICVDVHVHRISNRWGYVNTNNPFETEMTLRKILPEKHWIKFNSYLVAFGQNLCTPRNPGCGECPISEECKKLV